MTLPLVSIIMPVYNAEPYVAEAIESVIGQSHKHWEMIIVNDGSTDHSAEIIARYTDPRIHFLSQPNQGVSSARNAGLKHSSGEYICFLDADDAWPQNSLSSRLRVFQQSADTQFVDGAVNVYEGTWKNLIRTWHPSFEGNPYDQLMRLSEKCFYGLTWMVHRNPGQSYRFQEGMTHAEDLLFYISLTTQGRYAFTSDVILHHRKNSSSASVNLDGLANGYRTLFNQLQHSLTSTGRRYLSLRIRRIMFLSYLSRGKISKAFQFVLLWKL